MKVTARQACVLLLIAAGISVSSARADDASDHLGLCLQPKDEEVCKYNKDKFKQEYPQAYRGDYQSQRNAAYCLSTGCDGAVWQNKILGCAWRIVIIASGSPKMDTSDTGNLKFYCGNLTEIELGAAKSQASTIMGKIKKK